jgi:hypothetical protein
MYASEGGFTIPHTFHEFCVSRISWLTNSLHYNFLVNSYYRYEYIHLNSTTYNLECSMLCPKELCLSELHCFHLLRYSAVYFACEPTFRRNVSPLSSGQKISRARNQRAAGGHALPKRRFKYGLRGTISQKMATFITAAVRTSNPTCQLQCLSKRMETFIILHIKLQPWKRDARSL